MAVPPAEGTFGPVGGGGNGSQRVFLLYSEMLT